MQTVKIYDRSGFFPFPEGFTGDICLESGNRPNGLYKSVWRHCGACKFPCTPILWLMAFFPPINSRPLDAHRWTRTQFELPFLIGKMKFAIKLIASITNEPRITLPFAIETFSVSFTASPEYPFGIQFKVSIQSWFLNHNQFNPNGLHT